MGITDRLKNAWNAFKNEERPSRDYSMYVSSSSSNPQFRTWRYSKGSILDTIVNRIAIDVSMIEFDHIRRDKDPETEEVVNDGLHNCLTLEANIDQSHLEFLQDIVFSVMDEGVVAVVPVDTDVDPWNTDGFDILTMRVGRIVQWFPQHVQVRLYNDRTGNFEEVIIEKQKCAIIQNPLYEVVNGDNSTFKRLSRKLALMDIIDEGNSNAKLDLILTLPYVVKNETRRREAEKRVADIEDQLKKSEYGVAYIDGTERITQLNRAVESNILKEVEYLTQELFNQIGLTKAVFDGTAGEAEMRSYYDRTINPFAKRIAVEFKRKFLSKTARTQGHDIVYHTNMFTLVPMEQLASSLDTLRRNTIITANEARKIIGLNPSDDPEADKLTNPNIADANQSVSPEDEQAILDEGLTDEEKGLLGMNSDSEEEVGGDEDV